MIKYSTVKEKVCSSLFNYMEKKAKPEFIKPAKIYFGLASYSSLVATIACLSPKKFPLLRFGGAVTSLTLAVICRDCQTVCQNMEDHRRRNVISRLFAMKSSDAAVQIMTAHTLLGPTFHAYLEKKVNDHLEKKTKKRQALTKFLSFIKGTG